MDKRGGEGWELVTSVNVKTDDEGGIILFYKRPATKYGSLDD